VIAAAPARPTRDRPPAARRHAGSAALLHAGLAVAAALFLLPIAWMVAGTLKTNGEIFVVPPVWLPNPPTWRNYPDALRYIPFFTYLRNTVEVSVLSVAGTLFSCPPAAYAFARLRWPGRNLVFIASLATIMLPFQVQMIPLYTVFRSLGWIGTLLPLIVPAFFGNGLYVFLLRQFFLTIPKELGEAAAIDGASELRTFLQVMLPLIKPALITVSIFTFMANWTDFLAPLVFLNRESTFTLSLGLQFYQSQHFTAWAYLMVASFVFTLPALIVFVVLQRYFVQGFTLSGLKG
jgi:multiple sugar transport system permease protein